MPDLDWHYIVNQFDNSTKNSYKRAKQQGQFHSDAVSNAPAAIVAELTGRINASFPPFLTQYGTWLQKRGQFKGATQAYTERVALLAGTDIEDIETSFKGAYKRGSSEHSTAFPLGREPFQQGTAEDRATALGVLKSACEDLMVPLQTALQNAQNNSEPQAVIDALQLRVTLLSAARDRAQTAKAELDALRQAQNDRETELTVARTALHPLRIVLADALFANTGTLMSELKSEAQRPQIAAYFNLDILRETGPDEDEPPTIPPVTPP